ncbi:MAG TPA: hypothetical protein VHV77_03895, partial [Pirellulales bacterium]|nr:hypothetical protein [Pirellulales bacterium]
IAGSRAKLLTAEAPSTRYEAGPYVIAGPRTQWRSIDGELAGRHGVAYELVAGHQRAQLFVVDLHGPLGAPKFQWLPQTPMQNVLTTGGYTSVAWSDGTRVFVLVVEGDQNALRTFVRDPGAMA